MAFRVPDTPHECVCHTRSCGSTSENSLCAAKLCKHKWCSGLCSQAVIVYISLEVSDVSSFFHKINLISHRVADVPCSSNLNLSGPQIDAQPFDCSRMQNSADAPTMSTTDARSSAGLIN